MTRYEHSGGCETISELPVSGMAPPSVFLDSTRCHETVTAVCPVSILQSEPPLPPALTCLTHLQPSPTQSSARQGRRKHSRVRFAASAELLRTRGLDLYFFTPQMFTINTTVNTEQPIHEVPGTGSCVYRLDKGGGPFSKGPGFMPSLKDLFLCVECLHACAFVHMCSMPTEAREGVVYHELELLMAVNHQTWVLGTKHRHSVVTASACTTK